MSSNSTNASPELLEILKSDRVDLLRERLEQGLDPNTSTQGLLALLGAATEHGAVSCMRLLVKKGAAVDAGDPSPLQVAIEKGLEDLVRELLLQGASLRALPDLDYDPDYPAPIVIAIEAGQPELVELLLAEGCFVDEQWSVIDDALQSALDLRGKPRWPILESLMRHLASIQDLELPPAAGSVLKAAKLVAGRAKKAEDRELVEAVSRVKGRLDRVKSEVHQAEDAFLESRFPELFRQIDEAPASLGRVLLGVVAIYACGGGSRFSRWLVELGAAANLCDDAGRTPLMHVAQHGSSGLAGPLVNSGIAALDSKDSSGRSALDHLRHRGEYPFSHAIEHQLTHPYSRSTDRGVAPISLSTCSTFVQEAADLMKECRLLELLAHLGSVARKEEEWKLAAGAAVLEDCKNDCMSLLQYCLNEGPDLTVRNDRGSTVMHEACGAHHIPVALLQQLVAGGADITALDERNRTVLEVAQRTWPAGHECRAYIESLFAESAGE